MATWFDYIDDERKAFIERQHMFFVATASDDGYANLSPKGRSLLRVLGANLVGYLDYPGSGNETATHVEQNGRVTLMLCNFERTAGILRLYGRGRRVDLDDASLAEHVQAFAADVHPFVRQAFIIDVEKVQSSCGYAVPRMDYVADRETLDKSCARNYEPREIIDGLPAGPLLAKQPT